MKHTLHYILQDISHRGAHIGRELEVTVTTSIGLSLNFKKNVLPDKTTKLDKILGSVEIDESTFSALLNVTVVEHDKVFNDIGKQSKEIVFDTTKKTVATDAMTVEVIERRWFFWKRKAYFTLTFVTELEPKPGPTVDNPKWTGDFGDDSDQMILARILFAELRNTLIPDEARYAVASVIRNRVNDNRWANSYTEVITKDKQFSALNEGNSNRIFAIDPLHTGSVIDEKAWRHTYEIAGNFLNDSVPDSTKGANHYYDDSIDTPVWAVGKTPAYSVSYTTQAGGIATIFFIRL